MNTFVNVNFYELLDTFARLSVAFILGSVIGFERQYRQRTAGLRTNVLVCIGAAIFVDLALRIGDHDGAIRVISYVVSGVGFLGAGVIMRDGGQVQGINTAATLWASAAIGACAGVGLLVEAVMGSLFILSANTLLRPLVNYVNRLPVKAASSEITNRIDIIIPREQRGQAMLALENILNTNNYPLSELDMKQFSEQEVKIQATLMATSISSEDMESLIGLLNAESSIRQAFWSQSTSE